MDNSTPNNRTQNGEYRLEYDSQFTLLESHRRRSSKRVSFQLEPLIKLFDKDVNLSESKSSRSTKENRMIDPTNDMAHECITLSKDYGADKGKPDILNNSSQVIPLDMSLTQDAEDIDRNKEHTQYLVDNAPSFPSHPDYLDTTDANNIPSGVDMSITMMEGSPPPQALVMKKFDDSSNILYGIHSKDGGDSHLNGINQNGIINQHIINQDSEECLLNQTIHKSEEKRPIMEHVHGGISSLPTSDLKRLKMDNVSRNEKGISNGTVQSQAPDPPTNPLQLVCDVILDQCPTLRQQPLKSILKVTTVTTTYCEQANGKKEPWDGNGDDDMVVDTSSTSSPTFPSVHRLNNTFVIPTSSVVYPRDDDNNNNNINNNAGVVDRNDLTFVKGDYEIDKATTASATIVNRSSFFYEKLEDLEMTLFLDNEMSTAATPASTNLVSTPTTEITAPRRFNPGEKMPPSASKNDTVEKDRLNVTHFSSNHSHHHHSSATNLSISMEDAFTLTMIEDDIAEDFDSNHSKLLENPSPLLYDCTTEPLRSNCTTRGMEESTNSPDTKTDLFAIPPPVSNGYLPTDVVASVTIGEILRVHDITIPSTLTLRYRDNFEKLVNLLARKDGKEDDRVKRLREECYVVPLRKYEPEFTVALEDTIKRSLAQDSMFGIEALTGIHTLDRGMKEHRSKPSEYVGSLLFNRNKASLNKLLKLGLASVKGQIYKMIDEFWVVIDKMQEKNFETFKEKFKVINEHEVLPEKEEEAKRANQIQMKDDLTAELGRLELEIEYKTKAKQLALRHQFLELLVKHENLQIDRIDKQTELIESFLRHAKWEEKERQRTAIHVSAVSPEMKMEIFNKIFSWRIKHWGERSIEYSFLQAIFVLKIDFAEIITFDHSSNPITNISLRLVPSFESLQELPKYLMYYALSSFLVSKLERYKKFEELPQIIETVAGLFCRVNLLNKDLLACSKHNIIDIPIVTLPESLTNLSCTSHLASYQHLQAPSTFESTCMLFEPYGTYKIKVSLEPGAYMLEKASFKIAHLSGHNEESKILQHLMSVDPRKKYLESCFSYFPTIDGYDIEL